MQGQYRKINIENDSNIKNLGTIFNEKCERPQKTKTLRGIKRDLN